MLHFDNRISIDRPLDDVFAFGADPQNIPEWNYYVANVVPTSPPATGHGRSHLSSGAAGP